VKRIHPHGNAYYEVVTGMLIKIKGVSSSTQLGDAALVDPHKVDRPSGEGRGKPLDEGSAGPIVVENFGGGLCDYVQQWTSLD
jgi:hypothetical protein